MRLSKPNRLAVALLLVSLTSSLMAYVPLASAQTQYVTASPGFINLGMTSTISVTGPAAGTYTVVVQPPSGASVSLSFTFTSAGQTQTAIFGSASSGFNTAVTKAGTYNVFLEQGSTVVSSASFYATNQLNVERFDVVDGGTCAYVQGITRGSKMFLRFFVQYPSTGAWVTNASMKVVTFTLPDKTLFNANWHRPSVEGPGFWIGNVYPNWNSTWTTASYMPTATATDIYNNTLTFAYTGRPLQILPTPLTTTPQIIDSKTGALVTGFYNGQSINVTATVAYTAAGVTGTEILPGFLAPLDSSRGGTVNALVGWGYYNSSINAFNPSTAKLPGGLISSLKLAYTGKSGLWSAPLAVSNLPALPAGTTYAAVITAADNVPTPNTGFATLSLPAATIQTNTVTATSVATTTATSISTAVTTAVSTATTTAISTTTAVSTALSTVVSTFTQAASEAAAAIPTWAYAAMVLFLVVGLAVGFILKRQKK